MSLRLMRSAHRHPVTLPGFGDADAPDDGPLTECADCGGDGCVCCDGKGYFLGDQPMSGPEYERHVERMREDFAS